MAATIRGPKKPEPIAIFIRTTADIAEHFLEAFRMLAKEEPRYINAVHDVEYAIEGLLRDATDNGRVGKRAA